MEIKYKTNKDKTITTILLILNELGNIPLFKLWEIIYDSDKKHLIKWGRPLMGELYLDIPSIPPQLNIYRDLVNIDFDIPLYEDIKDRIIIVNNLISTNEKADLDDLSKSDIECIKESINNFVSKIVKQGCFSDNIKYNEEIDFISIIENVGENDEFIKYIKFCAENESIMFILKN